MPEFEFINKLDKILEDLGITRGNHDFSDNSRTRRILEEGSIKVQRDEIWQYAEGSFLVHKGNVIIVYISDTGGLIEDLQNDSLDGPNGKDKQPKFHFSWCRTLKKMHGINNFDRRYDVTRKENGLFEVHAGNTFLQDIKLYVCRNCLWETDYKKYRSREGERTNIVREFDIKKFLDETEGTFTPIKYMPPNNFVEANNQGYTRDWHGISRNLRAEHNWRCSKCRVDMSEMRKGLHVHHIDIDRRNNERENLKVLCALCHNECHNHRMNIEREIKDYILRNRPANVG